MERDGEEADEDPQCSNGKEDDHAHAQGRGPVEGLGHCASLPMASLRWIRRSRRTASNSAARSQLHSIRAPCAVRPPWAGPLQRVVSPLTRIGRTRSAIINKPSTVLTDLPKKPRWWRGRVRVLCEATAHGHESSLLQDFFDGSELFLHATLGFSYHHRLHQLPKALWLCGPRHSQFCALLPRLNKNLAFVVN